MQSDNTKKYLGRHHCRKKTLERVTPYTLTHLPSSCGRSPSRPAPNPSSLATVPRAPKAQPYFALYRSADLENTSEVA
ncbi:hypothetical protein KC357_g293 [Hortaea werneckii]|nr:hypothetical protein KC357_g293 [Hortaea werneckii]